MKIGMAGPSLEYIGGISAVVKAWQASPALDGVELRYFSTVGVGSSRRKKLQMIKGQASYAATLARGWRPDLMHIHFGGIASFKRKLFYIAEAKAAGLPVVLQIHGSDHVVDYHAEGARQARLVEGVLRRASAVVTVSERMRQEVLGWMGEDFPVHRIYNPVETGAYLPPAGFQPRPKEGPEVLFIGWIIEAKGIFDMLRVARRVRDAVPGARLRFGGDGADMERFKAAVVEMGLEDCVDVMGWVVGEDKLRAFWEADVFCLPSYSEGLPISVLEAMSAGLPVVATDLHGIAEEVVEGETGLLFQPRDLDALAEKLIALLRDRARSAAMGAAGRERVRALFDRDVVAPRAVSVWRSVLEGSPIP